MTRRKNVLLKLILCISILIVSVGIEYLGFNFHLLFQDSTQRGVLTYPLSQLKTNGFAEKDGVLEAVSEQASIQVAFDDMYVNKLEYGYDSESSFKADIVLSTFDKYGAPIQEEQKDSSSSQLNRSVQNIRAKLSQLEISIPKGVKITYFQINNQIQFNIIRYLFIAGFLLLFAFLICYRKLIAKKIEIGFLVLSVGVGLLMVLVLPVQSISWDEQIHFTNVYKQNFTSAVVWTETAEQFNLVREPAGYSFEERTDAMRYLDENANYHAPTRLEEKSKWINYNDFGYLVQSLFFKAARVVGLPFSLCFMLGRLGNMLCYCIVMFFAIRHIKIGKRIMTVIGLMPTPMFLSSVYTDDPTVTAFLMLGFSYLITEILEPEKSLTFWPAAVFVGAILFGCFPKAVYIPIILLALLLPEQKFPDKRSMWIFKIGIVFLFLLVMSTFVLPTVSNPSSTGDLRGGDTSESRQLALIFGHPFAYMQVLWDSFRACFGNYIIGSSSMLHFAYLGEAVTYNTQIFMGALLLFTVFTDTCSNKEENPIQLKLYQKGFLLILLVGVICLIWTALYISFTPVGLMQINGVQGRYYLPLLVPFYFLIRSTKIRNNFSPEKYHLGLLCGSASLLFFMMYKYIVEARCF